MTDRIDYTTWWHGLTDDERKRQNFYNGMYFGVTRDVPFRIAKIDGFPVETWERPEGYAHEKATEAGRRFANALNQPMVDVANGVDDNFVDLKISVSQPEIRLILWLCHQATLWADGRLNETSDDPGLDKNILELPYCDDETSAQALLSFARAAVVDVLLQHIGALKEKKHHLTHERLGHRGGVDEKAAPTDPSKRKKWGLF